MIATWVVVLILAGAADAGPPSLRAQVASLQKQLAAALRSGDWAGFREAAQAQRLLAPGDPAVRYNLACAEARLGRPDAALAELSAWAALGGSASLSDDADLASLRANPRFVGLQRRADANRTRISTGRETVVLADPDLLAEDLAWDPRRGSFLVSSVRHRKVVVVAADGGMTNLVHEAQDGVGSVLAIALDPKRRLLWAATAGLPQGLGARPQDRDTSALVAFDADSGALRGRYPPPADAPAHALGDLTLGPDGTVYVSDGRAGAVYRLAPGAKGLEALVPPGGLVSPQTPVLAPEGRSLWVPDYRLGIAIVPLGGGPIGWLRGPADLADTGIDGLTLAGGALIAVQNGSVPPRIVRLVFDLAASRIVRWEVLERGPQIGEPTHGTQVGDAFFALVESGWDRFGDDGSPKAGVEARPARILRFDLPRPVPR
jgi:sugar lactone lactonase YvrE